MTEQEEAVLVALKHYHPHIMEIAGMYNAQYPADTTAAPVVDAVTVPVPLRVFMVMAAQCAAALKDIVLAEEPTP